MKKTKKILLVSVVAVILVGGMLAYGANGKDNTVVVLGSQKAEIDSELAIKSMDNVKFFEGCHWLKDGKILGIKDQPGDDESQSNGKLCIYNPEDKSFEEMVTANEKEWIGVGALSEDQKSVFYGVWLNSDSDVYDYYVLDLESKTTTKLVEKVTRSSNLENNQVIVASGMKVYRCDFKGNVEEISLPKELIDKLSDFSSFSFEDYLETYYNYEVVEGERRKLIESDYNYGKEHNAIRSVFQKGHKLILCSANATYFTYDMDEKTYKVGREGLKRWVGGKERTKIEWNKNGNATLWKINGNGEEVKIIEEGKPYLSVTESPDESKAVYYFDENGKRTSADSVYVYDLNTDEKIKIFPEVTGHAYWNNSSKEFFMTSNKWDEDKIRYNVTSIVKLND
ncbi:hypothetical protein KQI88_05610 [Alkaliphilus sp. MSJ-5]|uniref:WD40-like Beta Propeller Repeat n=1 Tax=Alkaliphilus flagellatus TaxID=2841507 RepID=A0ABS6G398_9FIRM|nr:hypothetical protein [Alkaliphilus flagellatus]MBU5675885.1 hypothetical protein [Alkaliphilus flagellatus]